MIDYATEYRVQRLREVVDGRARDHFFNVGGGSNEEELREVAGYALEEDIESVPDLLMVVVTLIIKAEIDPWSDLPADTLFNHPTLHAAAELALTEWACAAVEDVYTALVRESEVD